MIYTYAYPRPSVTVDVIILKDFLSKPQLLLIKRKQEPFKNKWALPGGFVDIDEEIEDAAYRELKTFGKIGRDPRGRTISVVYFGILENSSQEIKAGDDAKDFNWFDIVDLPELAFDHGEIINLFLSKKEELL